MEPAHPLQPAQPYRGQVVFIYAFDVAYQMRRAPVTQLMGQNVRTTGVEPDKRNPRQVYLYRPQTIELPPITTRSYHGTVQVGRQIRLYTMGAMTIRLSAPFEAVQLSELVDYHDFQIEGQHVHQVARQLAEQARAELKDHFIRPVEHLADEEAYTVFCLASPIHNADRVPIATETWLRANERQIAALLTQESNPDCLSQQETRESTSSYVSYYEHDLTVIDWDAALLIDEPTSFNDTLYVMELANLQLVELEVVDRLLDQAMEHSYRDIIRRTFVRRARKLSQLREYRLDLTRLRDELSNIAKFFGDWHLARIHQLLSRRFHLQAWHENMSEKLRTLDSVYQIIKQDQINGWMIVLEATIVLLFIIDLLLIALTRSHG